MPHWIDPRSAWAGVLAGATWGALATALAGGNGVFLLALPGILVAITGLALCIPLRTRRHAPALWLCVATAWLVWSLTWRLGPATGDTL